MQNKGARGCKRVQARGLVAQKRNEGDKRVQARGARGCKARGLKGGMDLI